jgi:hypothetical protein
MPLLAGIFGSAVVSAGRTVKTAAAQYERHCLPSGWVRRILTSVGPTRLLVGRRVPDPLPTPTFDHVARDRPVREVAGRLTCMAPRTATPLIMPKDCAESKHEPSATTVMSSLPAVNGTGTTRSIARLYGSAATGGSEIGFSPSILDALKKAAIPPTNGVRDKVMFVDTSFSLGLVKPASLTIFGSSDNAFGTPGMGGSFGFADPDTASATGT